MAKKKIAMLITTLVLVCAIAISGTFAYLFSASNGGNGVTNTFIAQGGGEMVKPASEGGAFEITEPEIEIDEDGNITEKTSGTGVTSNEYKVVPGTTVPKSAKVSIAGKTKVPAYLYVEIVSTLDKDVYTWSPAACWKPVMSAGETPAQLKGKNNGLLYVYSDANGPVIIDSDLSATSILLGDQVVVKNVTEEVMESKGNGTLVFYSYLAQASIGTPAAAFNGCFPLN